MNAKNGIGANKVDNDLKDVSVSIFFYTDLLVIVKVQGFKRIQNIINILLIFWEAWEEVNNLVPKIDALEIRVDFLD